MILLVGKALTLITARLQALAQFDGTDSKVSQCRTRQTGKRFFCLGGGVQKLMIWCVLKPKCNHMAGWQRAKNVMVICYFHGWWMKFTNFVLQYSYRRLESWSLRPQIPTICAEWTQPGTLGSKGLHPGNPGHIWSLTHLAPQAIEGHQPLHPWL